MCSGSEAGSSLRLIGFLYHSILGLRVILKKKKDTLNSADALQVGVSAALSWVGDEARECVPSNSLSCEILCMPTR